MKTDQANLVLRAIEQTTTETTKDARDAFRDLSMNLGSLIWEEDHKEKLMKAAPALEQAARDFVNKVDRGKAHSIRSYGAFREALALIDGESS